MGEPRRGWPRTLYGRLVLLLVAGMLLAQLLTGTIWYDARYERVLEIPSRLAGAQVAQVLRLLHSPALQGVDPAALDAQGLRVRAVHPQPAPALNARDRALQQLLASAVADELGAPRPLQLLRVRLLGAEGEEDPSLFTARHVQGHFLLQVQDVDGRWLQMEIQQHQAGLELRPLHALGDYLLRIYGLRTLLIVLLALVVVRWLTRPLTRLAAAATALGGDIRSPPLPLDGPQEVRQAAQAFNQMQQRIMQGMQAREQLLAAVSHDLRSPLTRLRLRTELLPDEGERQRWREDLDDMQALVDSILDYSASRHLQGERLQVDMNALVQAVCDDTAETHGLASPIRIDGRASHPWPGLPRSLKRALANLLDNAVLHGGQPWVEVADDPKVLRISVCDDGPGVAEEEFERLLQPFQRRDVARGGGSRNGVGLGLSIADAIVAAHGGSLQLRNGPSGGLRATVLLPRDVTPRQGETSA